MKFHPEILLSALVVAACNPPIDQDAFQKKLELLPSPGIVETSYLPVFSFEWNNDSAYIDRINHVFPILDAFWQREFAQAGIPYKSPKLTIWTSTENYIPDLSERANPREGPQLIISRDELFFPIPRLWDNDGIPERVSQLNIDIVAAHEFAHDVIQKLGVDQEIRQGDIFNDAIRRGSSFENTANCLAGISLRSVYTQSSITFDDIITHFSAIRRKGTSRNELIESNIKLYGNPSPEAKWFMQGFRKGIPALCNAIQDFPLPSK